MISKNVDESKIVTRFKVKFWTRFCMINHPHKVFMNYLPYTTLGKIEEPEDIEILVQPLFQQILLKLKWFLHHGSFMFSYRCKDIKRSIHFNLKIEISEKQSDWVWEDFGHKFYQVSSNCLKVTMNLLWNAKNLQLALNY